MILFIIGALGILLFTLPFLFAGIWNVGNAAGGLLSLSLLAIGLFRRRIGRRMKRFLIAAGILIFLIALVETVFMISAIRKKPAADATVLVLGCKVNPGGPSLMLSERINAAYEYLISHPEAVCIASGGKGSDEPVSEAQCIRDRLVGMGIDANRILMEDRSTSTLENLAFSMEILEAEGLPRNVAIVTNEFHLYRACRVAEQAGLEPGAVPAGTLLFLLPTYYVRELLAILATWVL